MNNARRKRSNTGSSHDPATKRLIRTLVEGCGSPAEALELYYWSREPGLIEVIRGIATMPEEHARRDRGLHRAGARHEIDQGRNRSRGVLTLASAEAARIVALARHAAEDDEDAPRLLN